MWHLTFHPRVPQMGGVFCRAPHGCWTWRHTKIRVNSHQLKTKNIKSHQKRSKNKWQKPNKRFTFIFAQCERVFRRKMLQDAKSTLFLK